MKVLNFISGRNLGGSKQAFLDFSLMCWQSGFEVHSMIRTRAPLKALLQKMPQPIAENIIEIDYMRLRWLGFKQHALKQFKKATDGLVPDVIIVHKPMDVYFLRQTFPNKIIVSVIHSFTTKNLEQANHIFAVSNAVKQRVENSGCKTPITVINNSTEIPLDYQPPPFRKVPVIGTMAVFRRTKRLDLLLQAFYELKKNGVPFKGIIAGAGLQKVYLEYLIKRWNLKDQVELRPWVTDKDAFYQDVDIFCVTSRAETFNICLIEAMARNICVISTACGGPNEIIDHEIDGVLTPVNNLTKLTENLTVLLKDKNLRRQLGEQGHEKVQQRYATNVIKSKIAQTLKSLINQ